LRRDHISGAPASVKLPITPGSARVSGTGERVRDREVFVRTMLCEELLAT